MTSEDRSNSNINAVERFSDIRQIVSALSKDFKQRLLISIMFSIVIPILVYLIIENAFGKMYGHYIASSLTVVILIITCFKTYNIYLKIQKVPIYQVYMLLVSLFLLLLMIFTHTLSKFSSDSVVRGFGFLVFGIILPLIFFVYFKLEEKEISIEGEKDSIKNLYLTLISSDLLAVSAFFSRTKLAYIIAKTSVLQQEQPSLLDQIITEQINNHNEQKKEIRLRYSNFLNLILTFSAFGFVIISFLWDSTIFNGQSIDEKTRIIVLIISVIAFMVSICTLIVWLQMKIPDSNVGLPSIYDKLPLEFDESDLDLSNRIMKLVEIELINKSNQYFKRWINILSILLLSLALSLIATIYQVTVFFS